MIKNIYTGEEFPVDWDFDKSVALNRTDLTYHGLLLNILTNGLWKQNRTGVKTLSIFGPQVEFINVAERFPLLTTKKIFLKGVIGELLWFLSGSTNKFELKEKYGTSIWDEWGDDETGEMGPIYGHQWVNWEYWKPEPTAMPIPSHGQLRLTSINQLQNIIDTLKTNPDDRRMIVSAWHVEQLSEMALPPCHWSFQFYTNQYPGEEKRRLHIKMHIRSWDIFLGGPFNIASYAILLLMMAKEVDMLAGNLIISAGDVHIYENHLEYIYKQLERTSKAQEPVMTLNPEKGFWDYEGIQDFELQGYDAHPNWRGVPIAV